MEKTTEQLEIEERAAITKNLEHSIKLGRALQRLQSNKDFDLVFGKTFVDVGLNILWQNVRHLKEEQLKGRGSDKNLEVLSMLDGQIKSRLDFQGFIDTVENDANNAIEELREIESDITAEALNDAKKDA